MWVVVLCDKEMLTFICLRLLHYRMTLSTVPSDRDVRTRSTAFRVDLGTRYVTVCVVSRMLQEGVMGSAIRWDACSADCGGGEVEKQWTEKESFQQYIYNQYKILHTSHVLLLCILFLRVLVVLYLRVTCICVA
jgi:hypothetical protein